MAALQSVTPYQDNGAGTPRWKFSSFIFYNTESWLILIWHFCTDHQKKAISHQGENRSQQSKLNKTENK